MGDVVKFDGGLINNYSADEDAEFAIMQLEFLSDGYNSHHLPITTEVLKRDAKSILGKFIVAKYDKYAADVKGHETDEIIVGYIPNNAEITFKESKNGLFACVDGLISKLYSNDVYKLYQEHNHRAVSTEMVTFWKDDNPDTNVIEGINILAVTLLGLNYDPSCTLASSKIVRFSLEDANNFYEYKLQNNLKDFAERRKAKMAGKTYKVDTSELKETPWGQVDKVELRNKIMGASNRNRLVKDVYAEVLPGWEDAPNSKLKYPLMELVGDTFYYNRYALSTALAYARQEDETKVVAKIQKLYKEFELNDDKKEGEDKKMGVKKLEIEGRKAWGDVIKKVQAHEGDGAYVDSVEKDHIIYTIDDVRYRVDAKVEVGEDDKKVKATIKWTTKKKDADQKMSAHKFDDECDEDMDEDEEYIEEDKKAGVTIGKDEARMRKLKKRYPKLSSDANVDPAALADMLEKEAMRNQQLVDEMDARENIIMEQEAELKELRRFREDTLDSKKQSEVNTTLAEIQGLVDEDLYKELQEEGLTCNYDSLDAWKNKARALAFEVTKGTASRPNSLWRMGMDINTRPKSKGLWD